MVLLYGISSWGTIMVRHDAHLSIVIPTRNESENVERLISSICAALPGGAKELVFVDDSDDVTPALVRQLLGEADCPGFVLHREGQERKGGLSTAVVAGIAASSGSFICTMDGDLQHPAGEVPRLWEIARAEGADIVVGSRFLPGSNPRSGFDGWGRALVSATGRTAARILVPCARVTSDPLSGFFIVRRGVVQGVALRPVGYKILLEILTRGQWRRLIDVSYEFQSRNAGMSKATLREGVQFARHLSRLVRAGGAPPPLRERVVSVQPLSPAGAPSTDGGALARTLLEGRDMPSPDPLEAIHAES